MMFQKVDRAIGQRRPRQQSIFSSVMTVVCALGLAAGVAVAQPVPADEVLKGFQPNGDLMLELDGQSTDTQLYFSDSAGAFLIMGSALSSPVLVGTRTGMVESVHLMKVMKKPDGSIDLRADATLEALDRFRIEGTEVHFDLKGQAAKLKPRPDLLGSQSPAALKGYKPSYAQLASEYSPRGSSLSALKTVTDDVRVQIYFGTWCPTCGRLVPRVLRLDEDLDNPKIAFEYYGVPRDITSDPAAEKDKIHGVPTGIVYVGGKEVARLSVQELNQPEAALQKLLVK